MKRLILLITLLGVLAVGCEKLLPDMLKPNTTPVFLINSESEYVLEADSCEIVVTVATNVDYHIVIPEDAKSWLSVADTRADTRMETLTFIIKENNTNDPRMASVKCVNSKAETLKTINFLQKRYENIFETNGKDRYVIDAKGDEITIWVKTDIEYSVIIPEEAESWLGVSCTRAELREEMLTFTISENTQSKRRSADVELVDNQGVVLHKISVVQNTEMQDDITCPSNEIWYTNGSDTEPTYPYMEYSINANIISNAYDTEKGCWVITFDQDITTIGYCAFAYCYNLKSVMVPDSVTSIGEYAFYHCEGLVSITLRDNLTYIGTKAFDGSISLPEITIPDSVTSIGIQAFCYCTNLSSFKGKFASEDGMCLIVDNRLIAFAIGRNNIGDYVIPEGVTAIELYSVYHCQSITSVTLPSTLTTIGDGAFSDCHGLSNVTIPDGVTSIGHSAFWNCCSLRSITIPESIFIIYADAFYNCTNLSSVYCKATTPPIISANTFHNNDINRKIYVPMESVEAYKSASYWSLYEAYIVGYDF